MTRKLIDSGVAWLGRVPSGWSMVPLGRVFRERKTTVSDADFTPLSVSMGGVVPRMDNVALTVNGDARKLVRRGDYVINSRSDRKGSGGLAPQDGSVSVISTVLRPMGIDGHFAHHLLRSTAFQEEFYRWGSGIVADLWSTRYSAMSKITLPLPPLPEQRAIADFLDRETARIDVLIEKQTTMIALLKERRIEMVSHAVHLGLDPSVELVDHRAPWIGMIPAHWQAPQLRQVATMQSGAGFPVEEQGIEDAPYPFYKVNALSRADVDGVIRETYDTITAVTARDLRAAVIPQGSIVLAKIGAALLLGRIRLLGHDSCIDNNMLAVSPRRGVDSRFLYYALQDVRMDLLVNPGAVPSLSEKWFRAYQTPMPPLEEQREIADYLDRETAKIDTLIVKTERMIELSRERRSALITAAVTGQIDVTKEG